MQIRNGCLLCGGKLDKLFNITMPVFMGVNKDQFEELIEDMTFTECHICGEVQIKELLDQNLVYSSNHNIGTIGKTWENHYVELANFTGNLIDNKTILEIGDPSGKIATKIKGYKNWYIVEPNPGLEIENVIFIKSFFDESFQFESVDLIFNSHLLEHMHNPHGFFKKCHELLRDGGIIVGSIPHMEHFLNRMHSPVNILQFEHSYFINEEILRFLANANGFSVIEVKNYNNHSIFFKLKKENSFKLNHLELTIGNKFKSNLLDHFKNMKKINDSVLSNYTYLFGGHVTSQFYLFNGLANKCIKAILDNSVNKQGHKLYGTDLMVLNPEIIKKRDCIVICSHVGIYYKEIYQQLKEINNKVSIL